VRDRKLRSLYLGWSETSPIKAKEFPQQLKANLGLKELATNPLLLTLLCLVFEEGGRFPANRGELYKEGLDILLKKWDAKRNIRREEVYKQLSLQRKEDLLSQVAYHTFARNDYFFKQGFVEEQIRDYIRNLPNASNDDENLQLDSEAVLKSIEAHHGLLVERARSIYSFSHLTFQEYFTARWFKEKADGDFSDLVCHVTDKQWREVFLLTVGMLQSGDKLVQQMKQEIDGMLAQDEKLQRFLGWVEEKSRSVEVRYKPAAVRAYYSTFRSHEVHFF
jgi:predicted NACHT family NTPase